MRPQGSRAWVVVLAAVAVAAGVGLGSPVLLRVAYVLLALLVGCPLYADLSLRFIAVRHRAGAIRLTVGDRLLEVFHARSRVPWPIMHLDVVAHQGVGGSRARWDAAIGARADEEWTSVQTAVARGRYPVGVAELAVTDPFGLVTYRRRIAPGGDVVVHPRPRIIPDFSLAAARAGDLMAARRSWALMPVSGAVRPFASGDSSTRIHWLSSAHHGLLMVKDSERSVGQRVWVTLDLSSRAHAGSGEQSTVEYGVEGAAYVAELAFKAGLNVGLIATGVRTVVAQPARGRDQRDHLFDLLAEAQAGPGEDLPAAIDDNRAARPSDAIVMLTPSATPRLLDLTARLRRLGCGVAVVLLDAGSFDDDAPYDGDAIAPDAATLEAERVPTYVLRRVPS